MKNILDVVIIGAGPAGLSAAIYAKRAMLNFVIFEKFLPGGGIANTFELENYLGLGKVSGMEMADLMMKHVEELGIEVQTETVEDMDVSKTIKVIQTNKHTYHTRKVVIATGASPRKLGCSGEERLLGRGVSNCATCDGFLYKNKKALVVGGGDVAVEDAIYLSRIAKEVILVHRRDELRAVKSLQERLFKLDNVKIYWHHELKEIIGENHVEEVLLVHNQTHETKRLSVDGVFIAVGYNPNTAFISEDIICDGSGWIVTDDRCLTNVEGVYAVGDIRNAFLKQVATAVSDGAIAISDLSKDL